ncbi:putative glycosidase C21B10.07 [Grifola frondosa]|uniref:Putative glycosidase C21B10.07 n=1 Tax=Grifola frondosa TaxID=5627 RepID=A0A1C7MPQ7_GRIFR|nr:putative glycosidase C21B10.07 [Grifola frondosa]
MTTVHSGRRQSSVGLWCLASLVDTGRRSMAICEHWKHNVNIGQFLNTGEIDIIEGVHDNEHNQVTWHTGPNCTLNQNASFTGSLVETNGQPNLDCDGSLNNNAGCGVTEWSRASYGPTFDAQGGGVFAMKWDDEGIAVWSFYRAAVPQDVVSGAPNPSTWGEPVAILEPSGCNPITNFVNHSIVFADMSYDLMRRAMQVTGRATRTPRQAAQERAQTV